MGHKKMTLIISKIDMEFKKEFVEELKLLIPENVKEFDLIYLEKQIGYVRFNKDRLDSIYLENLKDKYNNNIILKFKYRDFHYVPADYKFDSIYICSDKCNEYRYDKDLKLNAIYLKDISILPNLSQENKLHMLDVLIEWQKISKILGKNSYISAYQIEKHGIKVKNPYIIFSSKLKDKWKFKALNNIIDNLNINDIVYGQRCKINNNNIIKENETYLIIDNKQNTNDDG